MPRDDESYLGRFFRRRERKERDRRALPTEEEPSLPPPVEPIKGEEEPGRNDPCRCGSGKKYKRCCGKPGQGK